MDARALLFLIIVLFTFWCCDDATRVVGSTTSPSTVPEKREMKDEMGSDEGLCTFCEVILAPIILSLSNTTNQTETLAILHLLCSLTFVVKNECNAIVDHYMPLFFNDTSRLTPENVCTKIGICFNQTDIHHILSVSDQQMQIVHEKLLEACNSLEDLDHVTECCKRVVLGNAVFIRRRFSKARLPDR